MIALGIIAFYLLIGIFVGAGYPLIRPSKFTSYSASDLGGFALVCLFAWPIILLGYGGMALAEMAERNIKRRGSEKA